MFIQNKKGVIAFALSLSVLSLLTGCGSASSATTASQAIGSGAATGTSGTIAGGTIVTPTPTPSPTATTTSLPAVTDNFSMVAYAGTHISAPLMTDNLFQVQVTAGAAGPIAAGGTYSNFVANYNCISFRLTLQFQNASGTWVNGQSVTTSPLSVNGASDPYACPNAVATQTIDFSSQLTAGHGQVRVVVDHASNDWYCVLMAEGYISSAYYNTYCSTSLYPVYQTHTVTGTLGLQVDGTSL